MNAETFKRDILPFKDRLYRMALRMLVNPAEAQDVVQEVMLKLWRQGNALNKIENLEAWSMRITRNHCLDKLRNKHRRTVELDQEIIQVDDQPSADQHIEQNETLTKIQKLMEKLPEKQRMVMQLRDVEGMTYKEIEEILDMPIGQVKTNLFRARQGMKKMLIAVGF